MMYLRFHLFTKSLLIDVVFVRMTTTEEQPGFSTPISPLSMFQKANKRSNASPWTNHDDGLEWIRREAEWVQSPGKHWNLKMKERR